MIKQEKTQYITDHTGKRIGVVLDLKTYEKMGEELDDYYCRRAYEKAKAGTDAEISRGEYVTARAITLRRKTKKALRNGKSK